MRTTKVGHDFTVLEWKAPVYDGGSKITNYIIQKREKPTEERKDIDTVTGHELSSHIKGLKQEIDYYFSVCSKNKIGISDPCDTEQPVTLKKALGKWIYFLLIYQLYFVVF